MNNILRDTKSVHNILNDYVHTENIIRKYHNLLLLNRYIKKFWNVCDVLYEKVTYIEKMNFEFTTKLDIPEEYTAYCSIEPEKRAYKVWILKNVLLRKSRLKFLEDMKMKIIHISVLLTPIWLKFDCDNKDTLRECRRITKTTDPNLVFFMAMERIRRWNSRQNFKN